MRLPKSCLQSRLCGPARKDGLPGPRAKSRCCHSFHRFGRLVYPDAAKWEFRGVNGAISQPTGACRRVTRSRPGGEWQWRSVPGAKRPRPTVANEPHNSPSNTLAPSSPVCPGGRPIGRGRVRLALRVRVRGWPCAADSRCRCAVFGRIRCSSRWSDRNRREEKLRVRQERSAPLRPGWARRPKDGGAVIPVAQGARKAPGRPLDRA